MKILCICDQGNNRSVTFAHLLKYWGNDTLSLGLATTSPETLTMLCAWADKIVLTEASQRVTIPPRLHSKLVLCDVGPDTYPRPFNKELLVKAKQQLELHRAELCSKDGRAFEERVILDNLVSGRLRPSEHKLGCSCSACTSKYEQSITR